MPEEKPLFYRLDRTDRIVEVGGEWYRFAEENDGGDVIAERIIGTPLFKHVSGEASRNYIWTAVDMVRKLVTPRRLSYRCDSPSLKRFMEMVIKPDASGGVVLEHYTVRVEPLRPKARFVAGSEAAPALLIRCSMCNRTRHQGRWLEPDAAAAENLLPADKIHQVAYGVCKQCRQRAGRAPNHKP